MVELPNKKKAKSTASKPVYIQNIVLENVKCFINRQLLDFADENKKPTQWTIILGENGTGKTTLLQHIAASEFYPLALKFKNNNIKFSRLTHYLFDSTEPLHSHFFRSINKTSTSFISCNFYEGKLNTKSFNPSDVYEGFKLELVFNDKKELDDSLSQVTGIATDKIRGELEVYGYGASRRMGSASLDSNTSDNSSTLFFPDVNLINAIEFFLQADYAYKSSEGKLKDYAKGRLNIIKDALIKILPDVEDIRSRPIVKSSLEVAVEALTPFGWINIKDLSFGYQTLMAWVIDLAARLFRRYPKSSNPLREPAVVLVDEIDLHLHPKWQRMIVSYLSNLFPQTQFIVTAHSPLIVQSVPEGITYNIAVLKREGNEVKIYNKNEDVYKGWRIDQLYTSDLIGLNSTRPVKFDSYLSRRNELMHKSFLTQNDKDELIMIGEKLDELSFLDSYEDSKALKDLRKTATILKNLQKKND